MSNLPETATFDSGIYQIETTDAVIGGVNGISNLQAKSLANRTTWLKQQVDALNLLKGTGIPAHSTGSPYTGGQQVIYQKNIWQANTAITPGAFNPSNWTRQLGIGAENGLATVAPPGSVTAATPGTSTNLAREDHVHDNTTYTAPQGTDSIATASTAFVNAAVANVGFAVDTGVANACVCTFSPAITSRTDGRMIRFKVKFSNTGATTINDGLGVISLLGLAQSPLQGGELAANGEAVAQWNSTINAYVLWFCTGGALQVGAAGADFHAMRLSQAIGRLVNIRVFGTPGSFTYTPSAANVKSAFARLLGAGGGGASAPATGAGVASLGSGGGAGAYAEHYGDISIFNGKVFTIGTGGVGGFSGSNGGTGGTTSIGGVVSCPGGFGGNPAGPSSGAFAAVTANSNPPTGWNVEGGTGPGADMAICFNTGSITIGKGGTSRFGSGGRPQGSSSGGEPSPSLGAGGGGTGNIPSQPALNGGQGGHGCIIVLELS